MQMTKQEKESMVSAAFLLISLFFFGSCFLINNKGSIMQSARLMPLITTGVMLLLSVISLVKNVRAGGFPSPAKIAGSLKASILDPNVQGTFLAIFIVAVYIFLGLPFLGFYLSSLILIGFITLYFVRRIKPIWGIVIAVALTAAIYLVFRVALGMNL